MATEPKKVAGGVFPGHSNPSRTSLNADPLVERDGEASSATVPVLDPGVGRAGHGDGPAVPQGAAKAPSSPVVPANVPARLRKLPRWVAWRYERKPGTEKLSKVPYSTVGKHPRKIDATKIENGVPYAAALVALRDKAKRLDGVGIILGDGLAGIDVDDCIDADGNMDERGQRISERFRSSYAEVSPSGRGFKVFIDVGDDAELAAVGENTRELEIYGSKRYFTVTGQRLPGHPTSIASMAGEFRATAIEVDALRGAPKSDAHDDAGGGRWAHRKNLTREQVEAALATISADCSNGDWFDYGRAIELQFGDEGFDIWNDWSATSATQYPGEADCRKEWARYKRDNDELTTSDRPKTVASIVSDASTHASPVKPVAEQTFVLTSARELMEMEMDSNYSTALGVACPVGVVVTAGLGGSGKSTIAATLAAHVTTGLPCPPWEGKATIRKPAGVLWLTTEEDRDRMVMPRHEALGGDCNLMFLPTIKTKPGANGRPHAVGFRIDRDLPSLLQQARDRGKPIKLVVADALPALTDWDGRSPNSDADVKRFIADLTATAMQFACCIWGVLHFNKKAEMADEYRMSGAQAWRESPRLSFITDKTGFVYVNKSNDLPEVGSSFAQVVVKVLYEIEAERADGMPMQVTARRAAFGPHLLDKGDVLDAIGVAKAAARVEAGDAKREHQPHSRLAAMTAIVEELFALLGDGVPAGLVWREVEREYGKPPNSAEKTQISARLRIEHTHVAGKDVYVKLPSAA